MNRREFLGRMAVGIVSACAFVGLPIDILPQPVRKQAALNYLRLFHNEFVQKHNRFPKSFLLETDIYDAAKAELKMNPRFADVPFQLTSNVNGKFMGSTELIRSQFRGWKVMLAS